MNKERIEDAIKLMEEAKNLNMPQWQICRGQVPIQTLVELHKCGNSACLAGYIAVSPMFLEAEGAVGINGIPIFSGVYGEEAISKYLEIPEALADNLILGINGFYPVPFSDVKPLHVINKLNQILSGELV